MRSSYDTPHDSELNHSDSSQFVWISKEVTIDPVGSRNQPKPRFIPFQFIRQWLDNLEVADRETAHMICRSIPSQCPFERTFKMFGRTVLYIPPLCKLNPFYDQFVGLRFRAMCYLADVCGEDISCYC
ncbi:MAG TPA: Mo-dependent nitrogenase C-terminal domain-containing protein [Thermosynechococcaceae cyanobacterium]